MTLVHWDYPVVREMFVNYFSHFSVLALKNLWYEAQHHKDGVSLLGQSDRSMFRVWVGRKQTIDIIIFNLIDKVLCQDSIYWKPVEIVTWIVLGNYLNFCLGIIRILGASDKFANFINKITAIVALVSYIAYYEPLSGDGWDQSILKNEHNSIEVYSFNQEALSLLILEQGLKTIVNEVSLMHIGYEGLKILIVVVHRFKELEETFNDLHVGLLEALI